MSALRAFLVLSIAVGCAASAVVPAAAQGPELKIKVTASCEKGDAQFEIVNVGEAWPEMTMVSLIRMDTQAVIAEREMRMRPGQRMIYRAKDAPKQIEIGVRIESTWAKRAPAYDSIIACAEPPASEAPGAVPPPAASPPPAAAPPSAPR